MEKDIIIRDFANSDIEGLIRVFNYFAINSFAVYSESPLTAEHFNLMIAQTRIALVIENEKQIIGFGYISKFKPFPNFDGTGLLTYFILPEFTGKGIGKNLFNTLITRGREIGISNYLVHISSKNEQSLQFHKKMGFNETGLFKNVAKKFGELFDIVWMQKQYNGL